MGGGLKADERAVSMWKRKEAEKGKEKGESKE